MRSRSFAAICILAGLIAFGTLLLRPARAQSPYFINVTQNPDLGPILTDASGMTLYQFAPDMPGMSACTGGCARVWPPLQPPADGNITLDPAATGTVDVFMRDDGTMQVEYNGHPLYYYSGDQNPGDTNGNGIAGRWSVVAP
jgi:predicted lipoprotein with Yx(FWY)xxD motif